MSNLFTKKTPPNQRISNPDEEQPEKLHESPDDQKKEFFTNIAPEIPQQENSEVRSEQKFEDLQKDEVMNNSDPFVIDEKLIEISDSDLNYKSEKKSDEQQKIQPVEVEKSLENSEFEEKEEIQPVTPPKNQENSQKLIEEDFSSNTDRELATNKNDQVPSKKDIFSNSLHYNLASESDMQTPLETQMPPLNHIKATPFTNLPPQATGIGRFTRNYVWDLNDGTIEGSEIDSSNSLDNQDDQRINSNEKISRSFEKTSLAMGHMDVKLNQGNSKPMSNGNIKKEKEQDSVIGDSNSKVYDSQVMEKFQSISSMP